MIPSRIWHQYPRNADSRRSAISETPIGRAHPTAIVRQRASIQPRDFACPALLGHRKGKNEPTTFRKLVKPRVGWSRGSGADVNHISLVKARRRAVALDQFNVRPGRQISPRSIGELAVEFNGHNPPVRSNELTRQRRY